MLDQEFLKASPIFKDFTGSQFETISFVVGDVTIPKGHLLFKEGALARSMFIVRAGEIELFREQATGPGSVFATLGEGEVFGEMAVIRDVPRFASARARQHCSLWTISRENLDRLREHESALWGTLMYNIAGILADRLATVMVQQASSPAPTGSAAERSLMSILFGR